MKMTATQFTMKYRSDRPSPPENTKQVCRMRVFLPHRRDTEPFRNLGQKKCWDEKFVSSLLLWILGESLLQNKEDKRKKNCFLFGEKEKTKRLTK
ncbi:hypothetical protein OUZ56_008612 [Daphnia magna]|uniref:Uncharacterized protein n=1 Tax=Daphnia magna TaxID=35525 RepID=A0ABR0ADI4_9CRUS|nr:hypothetical protein OUZ56_008612 [Daphnia magna]